jgi:predicted permease
MTSVRIWWSRLLALLRTRGRDADLDEEIETHLALLADEQIRRGVAPDAARAAAKAAFGGVAQTKDNYRDQRGLPFVETLAQDARYAVRLLGRNPAFAATVVLVLGLGIGANTAIFSLVDPLLLQRLPVARPEELLTLETIGKRSTDPTFSYSAFQQLRDGAARVVDIVAANRTRSIRATIDGESAELSRKAVSGNYFDVLGVPAAAGRTLTASDDTFGAGPPVAILSHQYWTRRFGQDVRAIGRTVTIGTTVFTIVGVAAPRFVGETVGEAPDVFTPLTIQPDAPPFVWKGHSTTWLRLMARPRAGKTRDEINAALAPVFTTITREMAAETKIASVRNQALQSRLGIHEASRGLSPVRENLSAPLSVLMAVVGLVLLIACANVANLLLARAAARAREISLRVALGASRMRVVRQLLVEALLLSCLGGALGLVLGLWGARGLVAIASRTPLPLSFAVHLDRRMFAFTAAVSFLAAMVSGLVPALRTASPSLISALKGDSRAGIGTSTFRLGKSLVIVQIAVTLVLLVAAGLFVRTLMNLQSIDLGFDPDRVIVVGIDTRLKIPIEERRHIYARLLERAESVPGVRAASLSFVGLFTASPWGNRITIEGRVARPDEPERTFANAIAPRYFDVMGIQLLRGRAFSQNDRDNTPPVAIVNEEFARQFFDDPAPLGRHVGLGAPATVMMEIVGVAANAKYNSVRDSAVPMLYVPFTQYDGQLGVEMQVKTMADIDVMSLQLTRQLARVDPRITVRGTLEMQNQIDSSLIAETLTAKLSSLFSMVALLLSTVGLYGLIAYMASQRTAEIGIRLALGAERGTVVWLMLRQVLILVATGMLAGAPIAFIASRVIRRQLFGLTPNDPIAIVVAIAALSVAAVAAGFIPARRASRLDPVCALRAE